MANDKRKYSDRREYLIQAVIKRRKAIKLRAVKQLGGECFICGYSKHPGVLDFHHVDPLTKSFGISDDGLTRSWKTVEGEIKKCVLLCANCHREVELGITTLPEKYLHNSLL